MRHVGRIESTASPARALTVVEAIDLREKIHASSRARELDLPDFTDFMLATGMRIGEAAAVTADALDLEGRTVEVRGTVIRIKGAGLTITARQAADQLGHAKVSMTQDNYFGRGVAQTGAADVLEMFRGLPGRS